MRCPYCGNGHSSVVETRRNTDEESIRRRRECKECGERFTTYETIRSPCIKVEKSDGSIEDFSREKLISGVSKACEKRPVDREQIQDIVDSIEAMLAEDDPEIVKSKEIGEMVMERLKEVDEVSYIRFASVYRSFDDVSSFEEELENLKSEE